MSSARLRPMKHWSLMAAIIEFEPGELTEQMIVAAVNALLDDRRDKEQMAPYLMLMGSDTMEDYIERVAPEKRFPKGYTIGEKLTSRGPGFDLRIEVNYGVPYGFIFIT